MKICLPVQYTINPLPVISGYNCKASWIRNTCQFKFITTTFTTFIQPAPEVCLLSNEVIIFDFKTKLQFPRGKSDLYE